MKPGPEQFAVASCAGKKVFENFRLADRAARRSRRGRTRDGQTAYHCLHCGKFHVGTSVKPKHMLNKSEGR